mmetsp:Transcript_37908/g.109311  ORF Transcript_37908/g.109311 Transcript_37908/m.109311 type:complete len:279 (+) Transcript_37908:301-1137(+)
MAEVGRQQLRELFAPDGIGPELQLEATVGHGAAPKLHVHVRQLAQSLDQALPGSPAHFAIGAGEGLRPHEAATVVHNDGRLRKGLGQLRHVPEHALEVQGGVLGAVHVHGQPLLRDDREGLPEARVLEGELVHLAPQEADAPEVPTRARMLGQGLLHLRRAGHVVGAGHDAGTEAAGPQEPGLAHGGNALRKLGLAGVAEVRGARLAVHDVALHVDGGQDVVPRVHVCRQLLGQVARQVRVRGALRVAVRIGGEEEVVVGVHDGQAWLKVGSQCGAGL